MEQDKELADLQCWENKCKRCGECCRVKVTASDGNPVAIDVYCPGYDIKTRQCFVYKDRFNPEVKAIRGNPCISAFFAVACHAVPVTCGYVSKKYKTDQFSEWHKNNLVPRWRVIIEWIKTSIARAKLKKWKEKRAGWNKDGLSPRESQHNRYMS
jgi:uncharacterized cysteine cluster protein YcgN (CxxCxxCC family)